MNDVEKNEIESQSAAFHSVLLVISGLWRNNNRFRAINPVSILVAKSTLNRIFLPIPKPCNRFRAGFTPRKTIIKSYILAQNSNNFFYFNLHLPKPIFPNQCS